MRAVLSNEDLEVIFSELKSKHFTLDGIAESLNVSRRTITDWKKGKYTIQLTCLEKILDMAEMEMSSLNATLLEEWWNNSSAGKKGSFVYISRYGLPGTQESRSKGGKVSYSLRKDLDNDIFTLKKITLPRRSIRLAELFGILIGDGSINKYQVSIYVSSLVDKDYALFINQLFVELFSIRPNLTKKKNVNCLVITGSSKLISEFLVKNGLSLGNKLKQGLDIPKWILADTNYTMACLRGIFDTDGCIYEEKHNINNKVYSYPRMSFVSMSPKLRISIYNSLKVIGLNPKLRNQRSVNIENFEDIKKYFKLVGTSNPKHLVRFTEFGGVG